MKKTKRKIFFVSFCTCLAVGIAVLLGIAISQGIIIRSNDADRQEHQPSDDNNENTETTKEENKGSETTQNTTIPETQPTTEEATKRKPSIDELLAPDQTGVEHPGITEKAYKERIRYFSDIMPKATQEHEIGYPGLYFVGDSIIDDWGNYKYRLDRILSSQGVDTYKILKQKLIVKKDGTKLTFAQAIGEAQPDILVIMLGSNDVEWMEGAKFTNFYNRFLDSIEKQSPQTKIYLQSITPVRNRKMTEWLTNERINYFNLLIANIAKTRNYQFLDIAAKMKDEDGQLQQKYDGGDGVHLSPAAYNDWLQYYKTHLTA